MSTVDSTDVKLESGENGEDASKEDKPRGVQRSSTLARLQSQSTMSKAGMQAALKSGGKENRAEFVKIFAFCVCMLAMLAAPGATMLGIYYGNDGPNAPCSSDVPRWFFVTGCVSASMAGSILVLILAMGLSFFCPECGGALVYFLASLLGCASCVISFFMFGVHDRSVPRLRASC